MAPHINHNYLGNFPYDAQTDWSEELQGVTHDESHWFFTQKNRLLKFQATTDLRSNRNKALNHVGIPRELTSLGYDHFGDLDYIEVDGQGYLFIPVEGFAEATVPPLGGTPPPRERIQPVVAVFRSQDLQYVGCADLTKQTVEGKNPNAGWCAFHPIDKQLYTSSNRIDENNPVFRYEVDFGALSNNQIILNELEDFKLLKSDSSQDTHSIGKPMQGGAFSPTGNLYLTSSSSSGGIHVFNSDGVLIDRSSRTEKPFKYEYHPGIPNGEEPEGITYWDIDSLVASGTDVPRIKGQVHTILLDNDFSTKDNYYFKHYRTNEKIIHPTNFAGQNWLITPVAPAINESKQYGDEQKLLVVLSGVVIIDLVGKGAEWWRQTVRILPNIDPPLNYAIANYNIPTPDEQNRRWFQVEQWVPHASPSSIFNKEHSVNSGFAVDSWRPSPFLTDTDVITNTSFDKIFNGIEVDIAVSDQDAYLHRLSYHITLLGKIRFGKPIIID